MRLIIVLLMTFQCSVCKSGIKKNEAKLIDTKAKVSKEMSEIEVSAFFDEYLTFYSSEYHYWLDAINSNCNHYSERSQTFKSKFYSPDTKFERATKPSLIYIIKGYSFNIKKEKYKLSRIDKELDVWYIYVTFNVLAEEGSQPFKEFLEEKKIEDFFIVHEVKNQLKVLQTPARPLFLTKRGYLKFLDRGWGSMNDIVLKRYHDLLKKWKI